MGAAPSNAIDVGDAVFSFLSDTQSLDAGMMKVDQIPSKMGAATESINETAVATSNMGKEFAVGQQGAVELGEVVQLSGAKAKESMYQARGEAQLLGEEFGIHLPRHVRSFIAELPGVGEALSAAFTATAVLFLIEALINVTRKVTEWIGTTFIFTEAMKASNAAIGATNKTLLEQADIFKKAKEAMEDFGLKGSALTQKKIDELTTSIQKNQDAFRDAENTLYDYRNNGLHATAADAEKASNQLNLLNGTLKAQQEQLAALQQEHDQQQTEEIVKAETERISAAKTASEGRINLAKSEALLKAAITGGSYQSILAVTQSGEQQLFQLEMKSIAERISALTFLGDKSKAERATLNAQLEKLIDDHNAKVFTSYANLYNRIREDAKALQPQLATVSGEISNDLTKSLDQASEAAHKLGFAFTGDVFKALDQTKKAYQDLKESGQATTADLLRGQAAVLKAQIEYDREFGKNTTSEQKQLAAVIMQWDRLTGQVSKTHLGVRKFFEQFDSDMRFGANAMKSFSTIGTQAFDSMAQGLQQAIATAILATGSFGEALEKATAQALATLAAQALVKALFYTAEGFAAMAGFEETSAAQYFQAAGIMAAVGVAAGASAMALNGGGSSAAGGTSNPNSQPRDNSAATQSSGQPTAVLNVQRFATGGLVTGPTLAVLGDAANGGKQSEIAVPLGDPEALKTIVDAFQKAGMTPGSHRGGAGHQIHVHVQGLISPDNLKQVIKKISSQVNKGQAELLASNSKRVTRTSQ